MLAKSQPERRSALSLEDPPRSMTLLISKNGGPMHPSQIKAGSCYRTPRNAVCHVIEITADDHVIFKTRNGSQEPTEKNWLPGAPANRLPRLINFAHSVIQEVPLDWNPATGDIVPTPPPPGLNPKPVAPEPIGARPEA